MRLLFNKKKKVFSKTVENIVEFFVEKIVENLCDPSVIITTRPLAQLVLLLT
jgi:hypothetical protein